VVICKRLGGWLWGVGFVLPGGKVPRKRPGISPRPNLLPADMLVDMLVMTMHRGARAPSNELA
jgi:hypothetical protein